MEALTFEYNSRNYVEHKLVKGIRLNRNYGQHNALLCGIREANGSLIVTIDDDLQHPPEVIPQLKIVQIRI